MREDHAQIRLAKLEVVDAVRLGEAPDDAGDVARVVRRLTEAHGVYDFQLRKADLGMIFAHFVLDVPVEEL